MIVVVVSACGGAGELLDARISERGPTQSAQSPTLGSVANALEAAQHALRRDGTGRFVRTVIVRSPKGRKETVVWRSTGRYDIPHGRSRGTATITDPSDGDDGLRLRFASDGTQRFVQLSGWRCWLALTSDDLRRTLGRDTVPGDKRLTGEVAGLLHAEPTNFPSDSTEAFDALVPLSMAAGLAGFRADKRELKERAEAPVVVGIRVESGRFVSWSIDGDDILTAAKMFSLAGDRDVRKALRRTDVKIELRDAGTAPAIQLPSRSDRVRGDPGSEDFDPNGCEEPIV